MNDDSSPSPTATASPRCFQLNRGDLRPLWRMLGIECRALSPCADIPAGMAPATDASALAELARDPALARAAAIVADPDLKMQCVIGGGSSALGYITVCRRREHDAQGAVAVVPVSRDALLLHCFDDIASAGQWLARTLNTLPEFLAWDPATLQSVVLRPEMPLDLPSRMPLETLLYLLHAIDMYRVAVYQNLLLHKTVDADVSVSAADFDAGLTRSLSSGDIRWLLPAFHRLTPCLRAWDLAPQPQHLETLADCAVITAGRDSESAPARYFFGAAGSRLGLEFYRTWHGAVGITLERTDGVMPRCLFLAPTAFANHLFTLEPDAQAHGQASYAALTDAQLGDSLRQLLDTPPAKASAAAPPTQKSEVAAAPVLWHYAAAGGAVGPVPQAELSALLRAGTLPADTLVWNPKLPDWLTAVAAGLVAPPAPIPAPPAPPAPPPASSACPRCHQALEPGMKFCTGCGLPVEAMLAAPTRKSCPKCATPLEPGVRFCTGCGTPQH